MRGSLGCTSVMTKASSPARAPFGGFGSVTVTIFLPLTKKTSFAFLVPVHSARSTFGPERSTAFVGFALAGFTMFVP